MEEKEEEVPVTMAATDSIYKAGFSYFLSQISLFLIVQKFEIQYLGFFFKYKAQQPTMRPHAKTVMGEIIRDYPTRPRRAHCAIVFTGDMTTISYYVNNRTACC